MPTIEIDFDVFKAITAARSSEAETPNDIARKWAGLPPAIPSSVSGSSSPPGEWVTKGVHFPAGTEVRARYKGITYQARVEGGTLVLDGKRFNSPSKAAMEITKNPVNGWTFWEARLPGTSSWQILKALRK